MGLIGNRRLSILFPLFFLAATSAFAAGAPPEDGFVLTGWGDWNVAKASASVAEAQRVGARHISIMVQLCQTGKNANETYWCHEAPGTPFAATGQARKLEQLIAEIHNRHMTFGLLPIVFSGNGEIRQWIWPNNRDLWFRSYGDHAVELGLFSTAFGGTSLIVASELTLLFIDDFAWRDVIKRVRAVYGGHLTISPVFAQFAAITFWDALDSIGISAYFPLTMTDSRYTDLQFLLTLSWTNYKAALETFAAAHFRRLMFVEVGYPNTDVAASRPWDYKWSERTLNEDLSRKCWEAFRETWSHTGMLRSFQIWALTTPEEDMANLKTYSPIRKASEPVIRQLFKERAE